MCASRMQRLLTTIMLGVIMYFFAMGAVDFQQGVKESLNFQIATGLQAFVIVMLVVWAITDFCPSIWFFKKILPPCPWDCDKDK